MPADHLSFMQGCSSRPDPVENAFCLWHSTVWEDPSEEVRRKMHETIQFTVKVPSYYTVSKWLFVSRYRRPRFTKTNSVNTTEL